MSPHPLPTPFPPTAQPEQDSVPIPQGSRVVNRLGWCADGTPGRSPLSVTLQDTLPINTGSTATAFKEQKTFHAFNLRKLDGTELRLRSGFALFTAFHPEPDALGLAPGHRRPSGDKRSSLRFRNPFLQPKQIHRLQTPGLPRVPHKGMTSEPRMRATDGTRQPGGSPKVWMKSAKKE